MEMVGLQPESQPTRNTAVDSIESQTVQMTCSFSDIMPLPQAGPRVSKKRKTVDGNVKLINSISNITELEAKSAQATKTKHKKAVVASKKVHVHVHVVAPSKAKTLSKTLNQQHSATKSNTDFCSYCHGYYYDYDSDDEDWVKCTSCDLWFHESCSGFNRGNYVQ